MVVFAATFGPVHTERELRRMNRCGVLGEHSGCWVNDYDCGHPECPLREHKGAPRAEEREGERLKTLDILAAITPSLMPFVVNR